MRLLIRVGLLCLLWSVASFGCAPKFELRSDVTNAIALCSGGYNSSAAAELRVELENRSGGLITSNEITEKGETAFRFGELQGRDAVDMYNQYVQCINARRAEQPANEPSGDGVVEGEVEIVSCPVEFGFWASGRAARYTCLLRNNTASARACKLLTTCALEVDGEVLATYESRVNDIALDPYRVREVSGSVRCRGTSSLNLTLIKTLVCER